MSFRIDFNSLRAPRRQKNGTLLVDGYASRTGVFSYVRSDGSVQREYRPPSEVFAEPALAGYEGAVICDGHPPEGGITTDNAKRHAVGAVLGRATADGDHVAVAMSIFDKKMIEKVQSGKAVELSAGYQIDYDPTPGTTPDGERYDGVQRNVRINHLAIVPRARAGATARIRLDGDDDAVQFTSARADIADAIAERHPSIRIDAALSDRDYFLQVISEIAGPEALDALTLTGEPLRERSDDFIAGGAEWCVHVGAGPLARRKRTAAPRGTAARADVQSARAKMESSLWNAWRAPIGVKKDDN